MPDKISQVIVLQKVHCSECGYEMSRETPIEKTAAIELVYVCRTALCKNINKLVKIALTPLSCTEV